jgi:Tol biopolymer transport system component
MHGLAWNPDGRSVIVGATPSGDTRLYRVSIDGRSAPEPIEEAGFKADFPTTSCTGNRLVFERNQWDADIYRLHPGRGAPEPLVKTSRWEAAPQYSPDGQKVAFTSNLTEGRFEIWVADADGSNQSRLTYGPGRNKGTARWSPPDGRWIAFDSQDDAGQYDIYVIDASGGQRRRITFDKSNQNHPSFSHDGQWIYYTSNQTGRSEVWRSPFAGGEPVRVTTDGGWFPLESGDGKMLVYLKTTGELFAKPLAGGPERRLASTIAAEAMFAVAENRVYYWGDRSTDRGYPLLFHDLLSQTSEEVARVAMTWEQIMQGLSVSPDRQTILFAANELHPGMDLWVIENFR